MSGIMNDDLPLVWDKTTVVFSPLPTKRNRGGTLQTMEEFFAGVRCGGLMEDDCDGFYVCGNRISNISLMFSDNKSFHPPWATHVVVWSS
jgi:hypothetical protein